MHILNAVSEGSLSSLSDHLRNELHLAPLWMLVFRRLHDQEQRSPINIPQVIRLQRRRNIY